MICRYWTRIPWAPWCSRRADPLAGGQGDGGDSRARVGPCSTIGGRYPAWPLRCLSLLIALTAGPAQAAGLLAGPMAGASAPDKVTIWLLSDADARVTLDYWPADEPARLASSLPVLASAANGRAALVRLEGLKPATRYHYRVRLDGQLQAPDQRFGFVTQSGEGRAPRDFSLAAGSCAWLDDPPDPRAGESRIFDSIAASKPDVMVWLGDTIYFRDRDFDGDPAERMNARWLATRSYPPLQRLLQTGQHYAIWDDHDYGPDNSNRGFAHKSKSLELFRRYWANGEYGLADVPGIFSRVSYEDVDIFLLDDRYYRDDDAAPDGPGKTMLGAAQLEWLKRELLRSRASFKLIANGSRMLSDRPSTIRRGGEGWHNHPEERAAFLDWLAAKRIDGVLFLSGDIHYSHLIERERPGHYPLIELTCSPLTSRVHPRPNPVSALPDTVVLERNFCSLEFSGPPGSRELSLSVRSADGKQLWARRYPARRLRESATRDPG